MKLRKQQIDDKHPAPESLPWACRGAEQSNLELWFRTGGVPEMENLNHLFALVDSVINANGRMEKLANFRQPRKRRAKVGESLQEFDVVKECRTEPLGCRWIVSANVVENGL
jgi:hypothetical protein